MDKKIDITKVNDLAPIKKQVSLVGSSANSLKINSAPDLVKATDILGKIKSIGKDIKKWRESITKPLNEALKNARDLFRPLENDWSEAERIVKKKMVDFNVKQQAKAAEKEAKIEKQVEKGEIDMEKGAEKLEKVAPPNKIEADKGSIQFRTIKKIVIFDKSKLPREFLIPDTVKIRKVALAGIDIAGVKVVEEKQVSASSN